MPSPTVSRRRRRTDRLLAPSGRHALRRDLHRRDLLHRVLLCRGLVRRVVIVVARAALVAVCLAWASTSLAAAAGWGGPAEVRGAIGPPPVSWSPSSGDSLTLPAAVPEEAATPPQAAPTAQDATTRPTPAGRWGWPLDPRPSVLRRFEAPDGPYAAGHRGVDLAARPGQPVLSPTAGTVTFAGTVAGQPVVVVTHPGGVRSTFQPVTATRAVGAVVVRGDRVGLMSATTGHCAPASCLHWGVLRGTTYLDPLTFVQAGPVVLLPLPAAPS